MGALVTIDETSSAAPFEQIRAQLAAQITAASLVAGTRLPTVRRLAEDLGLAVNTVAKAYRELEGAGLIETRGRLGTVVSAAGDKSRDRVQRAAHLYAATAHQVGIDSEEALQIVRAALAQA